MICAMLLISMNLTAQRKKVEKEADPRADCEAKGFKWGRDEITDKYACFNPADYTTIYPKVLAPKWKKTGGVRTATIDVVDLQDMTSNAQGHLFVGVYNGGLYGSRDNGATYQLLSTPARGWKDENSSVVAIHVTKESVLFASADSYGIYRSKNNGEMWQKFNEKNGLPEFQKIHQIVSLPGGVLFAAVEYNGIYRSKNNGETWARVSVGLPDAFNEGKCMITTNDAGEVYVMAEETNIPNERGIYSTTDKGDSWSMVTDVPTLNKNFIVNNNNESIVLQSLIAVDDNTLVLGTNNGTMQSTDKGATWTMTEEGMHFYADYGSYIPRDKHKYIPSIERIMKDSFGNVYALAWRIGVFMSTDKGKTWSFLMEDRTQLRYVAAIAVNPQGVLFTANSDGDYKGYVYSSATAPGEFLQVVLTPEQ